MPHVALDPELAQFLHQGITVHAGSRDAHNVPNLSRALGCRFSGDMKRLTVFVLASHSGAMLADFRANGHIAVVISKPSSHRTIQLKGTDAAVESLQEDDHVLIARQRDAFIKELTDLGYRIGLPKTLLSGARADVIAVGFTITAAFSQTPGPAAGTPLAR